MTSTETHTDLDPRTVYGRAHATSRTVLNGIGPDQFDLPTPCDEFDVRALAGHLLGVAQRVRNVGRGESPFSVPEVVEGVADDGWVTTCDEVAATWADDATLERMVELPWATLPGPTCPTARRTSTPPFAAAVEAPEDAPLIDRLVAWNGRDPR